MRAMYDARDPESLCALCCSTCVSIAQRCKETSSRFTASLRCLYARILYVLSEIADYSGVRWQTVFMLSTVRRVGVFAELDEKIIQWKLWWNRADGAHVSFKANLHRCVDNLRTAKRLPNLQLYTAVVSQSRRSKFCSMLFLMPQFVFDFVYHEHLCNNLSS